MERTSEMRAEAKREAVLKKRGTSVPDEREKEYLYWLCRVDGIGAVKSGKLLEYAGSFEEIYNMK